MGAIVALAVSASASAPAPVPPAVLTAQDIGTRLRVFARPGDFKLSNRARQSFQRALEIDPNNQAARRGLTAVGG